MIKKHPQGRAERMLLNERHKKRQNSKGRNIKEIHDEPSRALLSDSEDRRKNN